MQDVAGELEVKKDNKRQCGLRAASAVTGDGVAAF